MSINRRSFLLSAATLTPVLRARGKSSALAVQVRYTGPGTVDQAHKLYVSIWDTPDFSKEGSKLQALDSKALSTSSGSVTFDKIAKNPVYLSLVFDPAGRYDGKAAPPAKGVSIGYFADPAEPKIPAPIQLEPGKTKSITARLDDATKTK